MGGLNLNRVRGGDLLNSWNKNVCQSFVGFQLFRGLPKACTNWRKS